MPNLSHLWQRFLLASSLLVGVAIGVGVSVFGYSNLATVDVHWSVFHINGVPLWTVVVVPLAILLAAGTLYHWVDGLHHFTEHHRHRRRVHELEAELASLRAHLDQVLEMPDHSGVTAKGPAKASLPAPEEESFEPVLIDAAPDATAGPASEPAPRKGGDRKKRAQLPAAPEPVAAPAGEQPNGEAAAPKAEAAQSETEPVAPSGA